MDSSPALEAAGLVVRYGKRTAVDGFTLSLPRGEVALLLGPNGAGKSTLLLAIAGVIGRVEGRVAVAGRDLEKEPLAARAALGLCEQPPALYDFFTVREHLAFVAEARTGAPPEPGALDTLMARLGLGAAADRLCRELSFGMRQRVGLGAALVGAPPMILLDETLNGLDPRAARRAREVLKEAAGEGRSVLLSTHLLGVAEHLATRLLLMDQGRLVADVHGEALTTLVAGGATALEAFYLSHIADEPEAR